jgi:alpha-tubulin suppressor-like RCC1 family protein
MKSARSSAVLWAILFSCLVSIGAPAWATQPHVSGGFYHTVGLKADGTVVATGDNSYGQRDVSGWSGIVQVAGGYQHTLGLKSDGAVVAIGNNGNGQCNASMWRLGPAGQGMFHMIPSRRGGGAVVYLE